MYMGVTHCILQNFEIDVCNGVKSLQNSKIARPLPLGFGYSIGWTGMRRECRASTMSW